MQRGKDFEADNAAEWEKESSIAVEVGGEPSSRPPPPTYPPGFNQKSSSAASYLYAPRPSVAPLFPPGLQRPGNDENRKQSQQRSNVSGHSRTQSSPNASLKSRYDPRGDRSRNGSQASYRSGPRPPVVPLGPAPPRLFPSSKKGVMVQGHRINPSTGWAMAPDLEKHRYKNTKEDMARQVAEANRYLGIPDAGAEYPGTGFYLWSNDETNPRDMFGRNLEDLNIVRRSYNVYIYWDENTSCLHIKSGSYLNADQDITAAIKGIKQALRHTTANAHYATPMYIVIPPTATAMKSTVYAKSTKPGRYGSASNPVITGIELSGASFSEAEKKEWNVQREKSYDEDFHRLEQHLVSNLFRLAPLMEWMRMRVHFGQLHLCTYRDELGNGDLSFSFPDFVKMMQSSRIQGTTAFDRKMDAQMAKKLMERIVASPDKFQPVNARIFKLEDVKPTITEIIHVDTGTGMLRLEVGIDYSNIEKKDDGSHLSYVGQYQIGTTSVFEGNTRNKRAELTTIDIERGFDWTLEIITDGSAEFLPPQLTEVAAGSVTGRTKTLTDSLGLPYPGVVVRRSFDYDITEVCVRSVYAYSFKQSDYIIEVAIYRTWEGWNTNAAPKLQSSVSMYHPFWDYNMEETKNTTKQREWDRELNCFFPVPEPKEDVGPKEPAKQNWKGGLDGFLHEAKYIKEMLQVASVF